MKSFFTAFPSLGGRANWEKFHTQASSRWNVLHAIVIKVTTPIFYRFKISGVIKPNAKEGGTLYTSVERINCCSRGGKIPINIFKFHSSEAFRQRHIHSAARMSSPGFFVRVEEAQKPIGGKSTAVFVLLLFAMIMRRVSVFCVFPNPCIKSLLLINLLCQCDLCDAEP